MRRAAVLALIALVGSADAEPKQKRAKPRGTFAAFIDPAALAALPPASMPELIAERPPLPPGALSIELVVDCGAYDRNGRLAVAKHLERELGRKLPDPHEMSLVIDCSSDETEYVRFGCIMEPIERVRPCPAIDAVLVPRFDGKLVVDLRCPGSLKRLAAAIRARTTRPSHESRRLTAARSR